MKIAQNRMNEIAKYSRNLNAHNKGGHGKFLEMFLADHYNFPQYNQYKSKVDFPKEIVEQGNVPSEWVADWEVKYYNINSSVIILGDLERKMKCLKNGLVIVIGFYDGTPDNLVDIKFIKVKADTSLLKNYNAWKEVSRFVKDRGNSIESTREKVKQINSTTRSEFFVSNLSRKSRWSNSQGKMLGEARQVALCISTKNLKSLSV